MREGTVVGIDPGYRQTAIVVWDGERVLFCDIIPNLEVLPLIDVLSKAHRNVAIERMACYGKPAGKEVLETCEWIGRMIQVATTAGAEVELIYRLRVKLHLCHSARATDAHVRQSLIDKHGAIGTKTNPGKLYRVKKDMWAALAVADTWKTGASQ